MRSIASVLSTLDDDPSIADIVSAAAEDDLYLEQFTDEEMVWLHGDGADSAQKLDGPWLSTLSQEARSAAVQSGRRSLTARGMATTGEDGELQVAGPAGMVADFRRDAIISTDVNIHTPDNAQPQRAAFFLTADELVMLEDVDPLGFHSFVLMGTARAVSLLAATLDPTRSADRSSGTVQDVGDITALDPSLDELREEATHVVMVTSTRRETARSRTISVYCLPDQVWAFRGWESPTAARYQLGRCSTGDIEALARGLMTGTGAG